MSALLRWAVAGLLASSVVSSGVSDFQNVLAPEEPEKAADKPNVIFILTDDQDVHMDSLKYMPLVKRHLIDEGTLFTKHYCTIAVCCPSRVSLWTGKAGHNTNVTDLSPPYGGYPKFVEEGHNENWLPVWLQAAGLDTYYIGKLFNAHSLDNYNAPYPANWTGSDFLLDPYTYNYLNATWQRNRDPPRNYRDLYSPDVLADKVYGFLDDAIAARKPFFLAAAPVAPHSNVAYVPDLGKLTDNETFKNFTVGPPVAAKRHKHLFPNEVVPRGPNFNPDMPSGVNWIRDLPQQNATNVLYNDIFYRQRLRALQSVDEFVEGLVRRLDEFGILNNTYIIYTADNGYHIGHHRMQPGKECGYEEDINVPLIIRGPGVPKGNVSELVTTHTDLVPTIFDILGIKPREDFDGAAIPLTNEDLLDARKSRQEHVNVEFCGWAVSEGAHQQALHLNNTYKSLRLIGDGYNYYYSVWCNNVHEFYDMETDPGQMHNLHPSANHFIPSYGPHREPTAPETLLDKPLAKVLERLDSLLFVLKSCKGRECIKPWDTLHPNGNVKSLRDALDERFDAYYASEVERIKFDRCERGYILDAEGPQHVLAFREGLQGWHWSDGV